MRRIIVKYFFLKKTHIILNNNYAVDGYDYFDDDYGDYYYFDDGYDYDYDYYDIDYYDDGVYDYGDGYDGGYDELVYYKKPLNYFEHLLLVKNNIENATSNDDYCQNNFNGK